MSAKVHLVTYTGIRAVILNDYIKVLQRFKREMTKTSRIAAVAPKLSPWMVGDVTSRATDDLKKQLKVLKWLS